jgi:hypothetical protein
MPKIFEYLGIVFFFYSNEHEPIHVHARYGEYESKAEFVLIDGKVEEIRIKHLGSVKPLQGEKLKDFKDFLEIYAEQIVLKWIDYFIFHKKVSFDRINKRIK